MASEFDKLKDFLSVFFLWINEQPEDKKYSFKLEDGTVHYTIRIWSRRREVDLHRTDEQFAHEDEQKYQQLFCISFFSLRRILVALKKIDIEKHALQILKSKITVGKLIKNKSLLIPIDSKNPVYDNFYTTKRKKSGKKIRLNKDFDLFGSIKPIEVEDGLKHNVGCFMVIKYHRGAWRMNGHVYKFPNSKLHGERSFLFFSQKANRDVRKNVARMFFDTLKTIQFQNKEFVIKMIEDKIPSLKMISK